MSGLEPLAGLILVQAVNLLFGEVKDILADRRKREERSDSDNTPQPKAGLESAEQVLALQPYKEVRLNDYTQDIKHCIEMIQQYRKNRRMADLAIQQYGGFVQAPPIKQHELENAENGIKEFSQRLKNIIEKVYGHKIVIIGLD